MTSVSQLLTTLQTTRQSLDRSLVRLSSLEMDNFVTLGDVTKIFNSFELLLAADADLRNLIAQLGSEGRTVEMQRSQLTGEVSDEYLLMVRDYAHDSSPEVACEIREQFRMLAAKRSLGFKQVAAILGLEGTTEESVVKPLGLRTLSRISVVREGMAEKLVDEYGSLQEMLGEIQENPSRLDDIGVHNPTILADSLSRMHGRQA